MYMHIRYILYIITYSYIYNTLSTYIIHILCNHRYIIYPYTIYNPHIIHHWFRQAFGHLATGGRGDQRPGAAAQSRSWRRGDAFGAATWRCGGGSVRGKPMVTYEKW